MPDFTDERSRLCFPNSIGYSFLRLRLLDWERERRITHVAANYSSNLLSAMCQSL